MKKYQFEINDFELTSFFPHERIKTKLKVLEILMEATRFILNNSRTSRTSNNRLILYVDKMSRLFFITNNKKYSIVFPFTVSDENGVLSFSFKGEFDIDAESISNIITIIKNETFKSKSSFDFAEPILSIEEGINENFWDLLRELLIIEDGYIRYDIDEESYKEALKKGNGNLHPKNHYDIFYSSNASFKLGLKGDIHDDEFIDLLNISTNCKYL